MTPQYPDAPLTAIYGIGEQTAEQLVESGVETCQDLAVEDAEYISRKINTTEDEAQDFIDDAKATIGYWGDSP